MIYWTLKSLLSQPLSLLGSALGIALALILGLFLDAVFRGEADQILTFVERSPADVWVLEGGVENLHMARSVVSADSIEKLVGIEGVKSLMSMMYRDGLIGSKGRESFAYIAGIPANAEMRDQWQQATGWSAPKPGGITIPKAMALGQGLSVGDKISVSSTEFEITGFSTGTFSMANTLLFIDESDARKLFAVEQGANIVLVQAEDISPEKLAERIEAQVDGVRALTSAQLMKNDYGLALDMGGALISMMSMIGTIIAGLIVIFTAYAFVSVRVAELALVKALGAPGHQLLISAMLQTGLVALLGVVISMTAIWPINWALGAWVPNVAVSFSFENSLKLGIVTLIIAEVAALVPALYLQKVDPGMVFNG